MKSDEENSKDFLARIFLACWECGKDAIIEKFERDHFITKCKCAKWRIDFKIKEI